MGKSITALLKIQGWFKVLDIREEKLTMHLYLKQMRTTAHCPRCLKRTKTGYDQQPERVIQSRLLKTWYTTPALRCIEEKSRSHLQRTGLRGRKALIKYKWHTKLLPIPSLNSQKLDMPETQKETQQRMDRNPMKWQLTN